MEHLLQRDKLFDFITLPEFLWKDWPAGLGISKPVIYMWIALGLTFWIFNRVAKRWQHVPRGLQALVEPLLLFVRDEIVRANIRAPHGHGHGDGHDDHGHGGHGGHGHEAAQREKDLAVADSYLPLCWTLFFFILVMNLIGLTPHAIASTGQFSVTLALAVISLVTIVGSGIRHHGPIGYWLALVPSSVPFTYAKVIPNPFWFMVLFLEFTGQFFKPFALAIRLMANMTGGHVMILMMLTFAVWMQLFHPFYGATPAMSPVMGIPVALVSIGAAVLLTGFEVLIALVQAYVFTLLTATFIGMAIAPDH
ncbi:MAG: F0F1 ATP synthase subunit A [Planctomycetota bacterium]